MGKLEMEKMLQGAYDIHLHASPSIFERWGDAEQTAQVCESAGMAGIVLKAHHGSTVETAAILNKNFRLDIFGGVVLNYFVGGLNPFAVDAYVALGAKMVWLPTIHADAHSPLGRFEFQEPKTQRLPEKGLRITENGNLVNNIYQILEILHGTKVVLATGHVSTREVSVLIETIRKNGYDIRVLVNHVHFYTPSMTIENIQRLTYPNVWFELSQLSQKIGAASLEDVVKTIRTVPEANWVMVSDSGQVDNKAPQALETFIGDLLKQGIDRETIRRMMTDTVQKLLF